MAKAITTLTIRFGDRVGSMSNERLRDDGYWSRTDVWTAQLPPALGLFPLANPARPAAVW
jgi:hypothetical protein